MEIHTLASICQVSCLVFLKSLMMLLTAFPTVAGSLAALLLKVTRTSGIHAGGGLEYGKAWINAPNPKTAPCRTRTNLWASGVGVLVPDVRADESPAATPASWPLGFFGRGLSINFCVKRCLNFTTIFSRKATGEHRIMPDKVVAAPARTSCCVSSSISATQSNNKCLLSSDNKNKRRKKIICMLIMTLSR